MKQITLKVEWRKNTLWLVTLVGNIEVACVSRHKQQDGGLLWSPMFFFDGVGADKTEKLFFPTAEAAMLAVEQALGIKEAL